MSEKSSGDKDEVAADRSEQTDLVAQLEQLKLSSTSTNQPSGNDSNTEKPEATVKAETVPPSGDGSSNNQQPQNVSTPIANAHRVEPEAQAGKGNNLIHRQTGEDDASTVLNEDVIMDDYKLNPEEEAKQKAIEAENKTKTDANNPEDESKPRPSEASFYGPIQSEKPPIFNAKLKCSQVRWFYLDEEINRWIPFNGRDSMILEIMYRILNEIDLDEFADEIYQKYMKNWNLTSNVLVMNGTYRVNEKISEMVADHRNNVAIKIERHTHFEKGDKLIDKNLQKEIRRFLKTGVENPGFTFKPHSVDELVVEERGKAAKIIALYSEPAKWEDQYCETKRVVFVVHGNGHRNKENAVVDAAKRLMKGVSGIKFIPIPWRKFIEEHKCNHSCSSEHHDFLTNLLFDDVRLYNCTVTGNKIREVVIDIMKKQYKQFLDENKHFKGSVSIYAHSLGSVVAYDILTNFKGVQNSPAQKLDFKVKHLYTVGSPLGRFIKHREKLWKNSTKRERNAKTWMRSPVEMFRWTHISKDFLIFNVFHQTDLVAGRLEPIIHKDLKRYPPVDVNKLLAGKADRYSPPLSMRHRLQYRIDHRVHNTSKKLPHVCYTYLENVPKFVRHMEKALTDVSPTENLPPM